MGIAIVVIVVVVVVVGLILGGMRVNGLRGSGTQVILREMPASGDHGWRHGIMRYEDDGVEFFRLRSCKPGPNRTLRRGEITIDGVRSAAGPERDLIDGYDILEVTDDRGEVEIAMNTDAMTAFRSWVESRPSQRAQRRRMA
ncbi:DUF2550 domain-containing protein [Gordonia jinhuaensis]|uniref:DUF2550 domain-containing protein n=1 Tax=Gordonia jinhuaensis TaxID=1517702 RepID=A0A916SVG6_9ACTN|nr:DUF2550 domain-containing protein [Gordonia jinhuaensis]GGB16008.1 hypothetical protein GCM10011489_00180 [Gordonia jinhuaensis]